MEALIIVDMINDFISKKGALYVKDSNLIVPVINAMIDDVITFPNRTHCLAIFANDSHDEDDIEFVKYPKHAVKNTWGSKIYNGMNIPRTHLVVKKKTFSAFSNPDLYILLKRFRVEKVYICGVVTELCVWNTAVDSKSNGFDTIVITNAIRPLDENDEGKSLKDLENRGIKLLKI